MNIPLEAYIPGLLFLCGLLLVLRIYTVMRRDK